MWGSTSLRMSLAADKRTDPCEGKAGRALAARLGAAASTLLKSLEAGSLTKPTLILCRARARRAREDGHP